jgi:hypothetical protein
MNINIFSRLKLCFLFLFCFITTGCATLFYGPTQEISVETFPEGATVAVDDTEIQTPGKLVLPRDKEYSVKVTKPGYKTVSVKVSKVMNNPIGYILMPGGFVLWGVDAATGSNWHLEPETLKIELQKENFVDVEQPGWLFSQ